MNFSACSVGNIVHGLSDEDRRDAYAADVTYATNNELGFDYLRDNMKFHLDEMVQRDFNFAIVDEVDSILIDEARTPLIISGPVEDSSEAYRQIDVIHPQACRSRLRDRRKGPSSITMTDDGIEHVEQIAADAGQMFEAGVSLYDVRKRLRRPCTMSTMPCARHRIFERDTGIISSRTTRSSSSMSLPAA